MDRGLFFPTNLNMAKPVYLLILNQGSVKQNVHGMGGVSHVHAKFLKNTKSSLRYGKSIIPYKKSNKLRQCVSGLGSTLISCKFAG